MKKSELSLLIFSKPLIQIGYTPQTVRETAFFTENINDEKSSFLFVFCYSLRLFLLSARYCYNYSDEELQSFVPVIQSAAVKVKKVHVFFNNHPDGNGATNAQRLKEML